MDSSEQFLLNVENFKINSEEQNYLDLVDNIIEDGLDKSDRTGVGTKSLFVRKLIFNLSNNTFPLFTHRKINYKNAIEEFLFMFRGNTQTKLLEAKGVNIWKGNTSREFLDKKGLNHFPEGEMGVMYGRNFRRFGSFSFPSSNSYDLNYSGFDQINYVVNLLKTDPNSRRITMTSQDVGSRNESVLDCCHGVHIQFYVNKDNKLDLAVTCRSSDIILGISINVPFYALFLITIAKITGFQPNDLIMVMNDVHIYNNHIEKAKDKVLTREVFKFPKLNIKKDIQTIKDIENLKFEDFEIINYEHKSHLIFDMAV